MRFKSIKTLVFLILCMLPGLISAEIRAIWVLPWSITSPAQIDKMLSEAIAANLTDILIEVRYRSDALYKPNRNKDSYPNPEPRSYILPDNGFDPLEYTLRKAQPLNLKVHAWVVVFNATPLNNGHLANNYIYRNHFNWITHDRNGKQMNSPEQFGYFIDPGVPEVREHVLNVLSDLVSGYPELDGLHLDYIRYPNTTWGYHPISVQRYETHKITHGYMSWNQWRIMQVTSFVDQVSRQVKSINPSILLSAAVFANYTDAVNAYAQEWKDWLDKGLVDQIYPMAYNVDLSEYNRHLSTIAAMGYNDRIVIGVRAWDANGGSLLSSNPNAFSRYYVEDVATRIAINRESRFAGTALFSYDGLVKGDALSALVQLSYRNDIIASVASAQGSPRFDVSVFSSMKPFAADIAVNNGNRQYQIDLLIPEEGIWHWEIRDAADALKYSRNRYYLKGTLVDFWNGETGTGRIDPGAYRFCLYREGSPYQYIIPVFFESLEQ